MLRRVRSNTDEILKWSHWSCTTKCKILMYSSCNNKLLKGHLTSTLNSKTVPIVLAFSSFTFPGAPYRIYILFLPCHSYLVAMEQQQQPTILHIYNLALALPLYTAGSSPLRNSNRILRTELGEKTGLRRELRGAQRQNNGWNLIFFTSMDGWLGWGRAE